MAFKDAQSMGLPKVYSTSPRELLAAFFPFIGLWLGTEKYLPHHHPESKKGNSSEANSGSIHPYGRYGNAVKTRKTISTIAILWPVKAIVEKRAATVEVDTFMSPVWGTQNTRHEHRLFWYFWTQSRGQLKKVA